MNIIFLDVDGVLNSMAYLQSLGPCSKKAKGHGHDEINEDNLKLLAEMYHACNATIVLTSTWKDLEDEEYPDCMKMYKYLTDSLEKFGMYIYDKTEDIDHNRPLEIKTWLDKHKNIVTKYVSLDDDFDYNDYKKHGIESCLVKTNFYGEIGKAGLQRIHVDMAENILMGGTFNADGSGKTEKTD